MTTASGALPSVLAGDALSRGDLLRVDVEQDPTFSGAYVVSRDGTLRLPFLKPIAAQGRSTEAVQEDVARGLVAQGLYTQSPRTSVLLSDYAPAQVSVSGAVFTPGPYDIGGTRGDQIDTRREEARGASTEGRNLTVALRNAGGVRPDADLSAVELHRGGRVWRLDLRPLIAGRSFNDVMLLSGDEITVPSRHCFQEALMVPSPISPPGISLFLSNLSQPTTGNASAGISQDARQVPYGTRLMQGVVSANCVGGARATSADRSVALFTRDPLTHTSTVIERRIEDMRARADRDDYDPYLLPGDAMACYDSTVTNIADVARVLGLVGTGFLLR